MPHINVISSWLGAHVSSNQKIPDSRPGTIAAASRGPPGTMATSRRV